MQTPAKNLRSTSSPLMLFSLWGSVLLLSAQLCFCQTTDVYGLYKGRNYYQVADGMMFPISGDEAFYLDAWARRSTPATVVTVLGPTGESFFLDPDPEGARFYTTFESHSGCDTSFPAGTYLLEDDLDTAPVRSLSIELSADTYPAAPKFLGMMNFINIQPGQSLPITWQPFPDASTADFIMFTLDDGSGELVFHTAWPGQPGALDGTSTRVTVPGTCFTAGQVLLARLSYFRITFNDTAGLAGVRATSGLVATTMATLVVERPPEGQDVIEFQVLRGHFWQQSADTAPVPLSGSDPFGLEFTARSSNLTSLNNASVQTPSGSAFVLQPTDDSSILGYRSGFSTEADLLSAAGPGDYLWSFDGPVQGHQEATLAVSGGSWPAAPQLLNLNQLQAGTFETDLTIQWTPVPSATSQDRIELLVYDAYENLIWQYSDPSSGDPGLEGTATQLTLPGGSISAGRSYEGRLRFIKVQNRDTTALAGATGVDARFAETRFPLATLSASPIEVLTTELPAGEVDADYQAQITVNGGRRPFLWTLAAGTLPPGVTLDTATGTLTGIPAANGAFEPRFAVQDATGQTAQQQLSLQVSGAVAPLEILTTALPPYEPGLFYYAQLIIGGGVQPFQWSLESGRLPQGMELQDCCGLITGHPSETGQFTFRVRLRDGAGQIRDQSLTLDVSAVATESPIRIAGFELQPNGLRTLALVGEPNDPYSVEASEDLRTWTSVLFTNLPGHRQISWQEPSATRKYYRARYGMTGPAPNPLTVTPLTAEDQSVTAYLDKNGASLNLTNSAGVVFELTIPPNAMLKPVWVTMTPLLEVAGLPRVTSLFAGVELQPEGLNLFFPGTLLITFPGPAPTEALTFAYAGQGQDCHLHPAFYRGGSVLLPIHHFSGYGHSDGGKAAADQLKQRPPCRPLHRGEQEVAKVLQDSYPEMPPASALWPPMRAWYNQTVLPNLKEAEQNDAKLDTAAAEFLQWNRVAQLLGLLDDFDPQGLASLRRGLLNAINKASARCASNFDPGEGSVILRRARELELLGLSPGPQFLDEIWDRVQRCWRFELSLESLIDLNGGQFFEHVRSGKCSFVFDPETLHYTITDTTSLDLVFWHLDNSGNRVKPQIGKGILHSVFLNFTYDEPTEEPGDPNEPCPKPPPPPGPPKITCMFSVEDPVQGMWVLKADGTWHLQPLTGDMGGRWWPLFKVAHLTEFLHIPDPFPNGDPVPGFSIRQWDYFGKRLYARTTYERPLPFSDGKGTETTVLELWHAPKRARQTNN